MDMNLQSEEFAIKLTAARAVGAYAQGKELPEKMQDMLRLLIIENLRESTTDEHMQDVLLEECASRKLDPEDVMTHFCAIGNQLQELLSE